MKIKAKELIQSFRKRKLLVLISLLVIAAVIFLVYQKINSGTKTVYQTSKAEKGTIISTVSVSGQIGTVGSIQVTSQASGLVKTIFVKNGDQVSAGQKLLELIPDQQSQQQQTQAWSSYLSAKNSLDSANNSLYTFQSDMLTKWKAYMDLAQSNAYQNSDQTPRSDQRTLVQFVVAQDDWLAAEAKYNLQKNVITQLQIALNNNWLSYQSVSPVITAPAAGVVKDITLAEGMTVSSTLNSQGTAAVSKKIASIYTGKNPVAQFSLSEIDVGKVKEEQKATITVDALPNMTFTGKVIGIDTSGVVSSGVTNYPITVQFDTLADKVLPNMSASAKIITVAKDDTLLVPSAAITSQSGQTLLKVLKNNVMQQVPVEVGISSDTQTEIVSGASEGEDVVTSASNGQTTQNSRSVFGQQNFGGGALRPGGFGGR